MKTTYMHIHRIIAILPLFSNTQNDFSISNPPMPALIPFRKAFEFCHRKGTTPSFAFSRAKLII